MAYADQQMSGNKVIAIILVALIHVALGYALITGLAYSAIKKAVERVTTVDIEEEVPEEELPPPPPDEVRPPPPVAPPPPINISIAPPQIQTVPTPPPPAPVFVRPSAPPPPPPPAPSRARNATPENQRSWQQRIMDSYPPRAVRDETEGRVGVRVSVGPNGRVADCSVTSSSGSSILDNAACSGMRSYARFNPAWDAAGNPTTGSFSITIVYQLN